MQLELFTFSKRSNSTARPSGNGKAVEVRLKEYTRTHSPEFELAGNVSEFKAYNYVRWDGRYYFINDWTVEANSLIKCACAMDVLATYADEIRATDAFVKYSASSYDDRIVDTRLSTVDTETRVNVSDILISNAHDNYQEGKYIIKYVTSDPTIGPSGCLMTDYAGAVALCAKLTDPGFNNFLDQYQKQFQSAYDCLLECYYIPAPITGGASREFVLGGYATGITGTIPQSFTRHGKIEIPWQFHDFRDLQPYTTMLLFIPSYGYIELNPGDFTGRDEINYYCNIDPVGGEMTVLIDNIMRVSTKIGIPIQVGTISGNAAGLVSGVINSAASIGATVASAFSGNVAGAVGGALSGANQIIGTIQSQNRNVGNTGSLGGLSGVVTNPTTETGASGASWLAFELYTICHNTNIEPSQIGAIQGRPLNRTKRLADLKGYVQTVGASVRVADSASVIDEINAKLDAGVYLE